MSATLLMLGAGTVQKQSVYANAAQYISQSSVLGSDSGTGLLSLWFYYTATASSSTCLFSSIGTQNYVQVSFTPISYIINVYNGLATKTFQIAGGTPTPNQWNNILATWNTNLGLGLKTGQLYINGASASPTLSDTTTAFTTPYSVSSLNEISGGGGLGLFTGAYTESYFAAGQTLDLSIAGNRAKFITTGGKPVILGPTGALPTGTQASIYLSNPLSKYLINRGISGNFAVVGSPASLLSARTFGISGPYG